MSLLSTEAEKKPRKRPRRRAPLTAAEVAKVTILLNSDWTCAEIGVYIGCSDRMVKKIAARLRSRGLLEDRRGVGAQRRERGQATTRRSERARAEADEAERARLAEEDLSAFLIEAGAIDEDPVDALAVRDWESDGKSLRPSLRSKR